MISLNPELKQLLKGPHTTALLLTVHFSTPFRATNSGASLKHNGATFVKGYWSDEGIRTEQQGSPKVGEVPITLKAIDSAISALFFSENWLNTPVTVEKAWLNSDGKIAFTQVIYKGLIAEKGGEESEKTANITLPSASIWADFEAARGRKATHKSQQLFYPNDMGMEFSGSVISDIPWGREGKSPAISSAGRGNRGATEQQEQK